MTRIDIYRIKLDHVKKQNAIHQFFPPVVIKLSVLSELSDIYTFGPTLGVYLQDQMSDRRLERLYYVFGHNCVDYLVCL